MAEGPKRRRPPVKASAAGDVSAIDSLLLQLEVCAYDPCTKRLDANSESGLFCSEMHQALWQSNRSGSRVGDPFAIDERGTRQEYPSPPSPRIAPPGVSDHERAYFGTFASAADVWGRAAYRGCVMVGGPQHGHVMHIPDLNPNSVWVVVVPPSTLELVTQWTSLAPTRLDENYVLYYSRGALVTVPPDTLPRSVFAEHRTFVVMAVLDASVEQLSDAVHSAVASGWRP